MERGVKFIRKLCDAITNVPPPSGLNDIGPPVELERSTKKLDWTNSVISCRPSKLFSLFVFRMFVTAHFVSILAVLFTIHHGDSLVRYYLRVL